jgi:FMN phosphatase YigB (HAD superfamily)
MPVLLWLSRVRNARIKVILFDLWKTLARATYPEPVEKLQGEILGLRGLALLWYAFLRTKPLEAIHRLNNILERLNFPGAAEELERVCHSVNADTLDDYIEKVAEQLGLVATSEMKHAFTKLANEYFLRVCLTVPHKDKQLYLETVCGHFGIRVPDGAYAEFCRLLKWETQGLAWFNDVAREIIELRRQGFRIGLVTNSWPFPLDELLDDLRQIALPYDGPLFDYVISSHEVELAKQDGPGIYLEAARRFDVAPCEILVVGDNPELDGFPAEAAGCFWAIINRYPDDARHVPGIPTIGRLRELYTEE